MAKASGTSPTIASAPHDTTVCSGTTAIFTVNAIDTPGTDTIYAYHWQIDSAGTWIVISNGGAYSGATTDSLRIIATGTLSGNAYRVIVSNASGSDTSAAATLTVLSAPFSSALSGDTAVCVGATTVLSDSSAGGTGSWSSSNTAVATVNTSGHVTGIAQGFATITYTNANACFSAVVSRLIRVDTVVTSAPVSGPSVTCVGSVINLTDPNVLGTHTWSTSNGNASVTQSGVLTGVSGGKDTITYTFTNSCNSVNRTFVVTVDTVLSPGTINGLTNLCAGSLITLTETMSGGSWSSSNSVVAVVDGAGNVTGVHQGTAAISYTQSNGCGNVSATHPVVVAIPASNISGADSVGIGNQIALTDTTASGTWSSSNNTIAVVNSTGMVTGLNTGMDTISYSVTNVCGTSTATIALEVGTAPVAGNIIGPDTVCVGSSITEIDTNAGTSGVWSMSNGIATITADGVITGHATGIDGLDTVYYTVQNGFGVSRTEKVIYIDSLADIRLGVTAPGLGVPEILIDTPSGGVWTINSNDTVAVLFTSAFNTTLIPYHFGTATITYTYTNLCGSTHASYTFTIANPAGVVTVNGNKADLKVYPNPSNGNFTVNLQTASDEQAMIVVTNILGEKVKEINGSTNANFPIKLDQPAGVYHVSVVSGGATYSATVVVSK
jgi:uncharacterized protein YjdB